MSNNKWTGSAHSESQAYYESFCRGDWADPNPDICRCHGYGWTLSELDTWHSCRHHNTGQSNLPCEELESYIAPEIIQPDSSRLNLPEDIYPDNIPDNIPF